MAVGRDALVNSSTGTDNLAFGAYALPEVTSATGNTALGGSTGLGLTTGSGNVLIGYEAGSVGTALTTGANNTLVGYRAQTNANNYTNGTALGNGAVLTASNRIVLGNTAIASIYAQVTSITAISDRRRKKDIEPLDQDMGLAFIRQIRPVAYRFNNGDETLRYGVIAQELEEALSPELQALVEKADTENSLALLQKENDKDGTYRVNYGELTGPIIKAIQEQQTIIEEQQATIAQQNKALESLAREIEAIKKQMEQAQ